MHNNAVITVRFLSLCPRGKGIDGQLTRAQDTVTDLAGRLAYDDEAPAAVRQRLLEVKKQRDQLRINLNTHAAHCTDGCVRAPDQATGLHVWRTSTEMKAKPTLPKAGVLAEEIRAGATIHDVATKYERSVSTVTSVLNFAGFSVKTGEPKGKPTNILAGAVRRLADAIPEWADDALCAQTDPDSFYPDKGGSTREAKKVCAVCPVQAECLDWALAKNERFGIWGGVSERERRRLTRPDPASAPPVLDPQEKNAS